MIPMNTCEPIAPWSDKNQTLVTPVQAGVRSAESDDHALLADYLNGSEPAFSALVRRHIDLVYSAALRQVRDPHTAADVTSAVFLVLARKARQLSRGIVIPAWLHSTTRFAALKAIRARARREHYEEEAARMQQILQKGESTTAWEEIAPWLDESLDRLSRKDHEAIILRFFQNKSFPEMAVTLGSTEEAVRKRVDRAVQKLHEFLAYRGAIVSDEALTVALTNTVRPSPPALASTIRPSDKSSSGTTASLVSETLQTLRWRFWRPILAAGVLLLLAAFALRYRNHISLASPLNTFRLLNEAANTGDGVRWSTFIHVTNPEEQQVRDLLGSNIVAQAEVRRALLLQFGNIDYERSDFPRFFDETPASQLATAVQTINGTEATLHLRRGSNLKFVYIRGAWKFDIFRTTTATPAQFRQSLEWNIPRLRKLESRVRAGEFRGSAAAANEYKRQR
jgi:RNA polymerase sigma factor (sigma-70 family)